MRPVTASCSEAEHGCCSCRSIVMPTTPFPATKTGSRITNERTKLTRKFFLDLSFGSILKSFCCCLFCFGFKIILIWRNTRVALFNFFSRKTCSADRDAIGTTEAGPLFDTSNLSSHLSTSDLTQLFWRRRRVRAYTTSNVVCSEGLFSREILASCFAVLVFYFAMFYFAILVFYFDMSVTYFEI